MIRTLLLPALLTPMALLLPAIAEQQEPVNQPCCDAEIAPAAKLTSLPPAPAVANLDLIKTLVGEWVAVGEDGKPTEEVISQVRVTAGGSAVLETLFPGTDHEMITMYTQDGGDLIATHYCVLGNQPRYRASLNPQDSSELVFQCLGGGGMQAHSEKHMHEGRVRIDGNRMQSNWHMTEKGEQVYTAAFQLARRAAPAPTPAPAPASR